MGAIRSSIFVGALSCVLATASNGAAQAPAKKPALPPKPVPPHQQFLSPGANRSGPKNQHMAKGRIFRHQGR